jgi:peptidyl-dipeptidase Dcp
MPEALTPEAAVLLEPWRGPCGGLPPFDKVTPPALEAAYRAAIDAKRAELRAITDNAQPATFANTIDALEDSGRALARLQTLLSVYAQTMATGDMPAVHQRLAPLASALDDEFGQDGELFARIDAVFRARSELGAVQRRLVELIHERMLRRGAALPPPARARLAQINARYAELFACFSANLQADEKRIVWIETEAELAGVPENLRKLLRQAATELGRPAAWAVRNMRAMVWPFLTQSTRRELRERVWRLWTQRGDNPGEHDNNPVIREILALRGEKARLLGFPSFAHLATADRMARTPQAALAMMERTWGPVLDVTKQQIAHYQAIADAEGAGITLAPWDRLHYAEKLRRARFGFDNEALRPYLSLDAMLQAMFWAAGRLYGFSLHDLPADDVPRLDESVRVLELRRDGACAGVLYIDLFARAGKGHGSYQQQWRSAETFRGRVLPMACITSNLPKPAPGEPTLLAWEYANVFFHEFGHALHMLDNATAYPSLGPMHVAWDFVELPSLLNERWFSEPELLARFARHHQTGEALSLPMLGALNASLQHDRVFSVNLDYLAGAITDMRMHLMADGQPGRELDPVTIENQTLAELGMPAAWDLIMRMPHCFHCWSEHYAAGMYVYIWAEVMAADVAEAFAQAPGGWYDRDIARRWHETVLSVGTSVPADKAFRNFRGRDPDPDALMRRFGLLRDQGRPDAQVLAHCRGQPRDPSS